jgi:hypothetical protein
MVQRRTFAIMPVGSEGTRPAWLLFCRSFPQWQSVGIPDAATGDLMRDFGA